MSVNAKFTADFSSFISAIDKAQLELVDFGKGAERVEKNLNKMVDGFSGRKLIQEASLMTIAIEKAGGVSTLTARELQMVGAKAAEAADKLRKLGYDVPPGMQKLADSVKDVSQKTNQLTTSMVAVGSAVGTFIGHLASNVFQRFVGGIGDVIGSAFKMNASLETTTLKFTTLMGDSDKAQAHVKDLFEIAKKTPFETGPIIEASLKLQTFGGAALNTKANIMLLGDAAAATGAPINELGFWVGRMYAMLQSGKPFGEAAMRLQELAVLSPKARDEMERMQKAGKSAADIFDVFKSSLSGFTGAMVTQAGTWEGVMSTLTDTVNMLIADTLKPYFEVIRDLVKNVNTALDQLSTKMGEAAKATADTKQAFADLVVGGLQGTVKAMSFVMVEFNAAKVVFGDIAQVIDGVRLAYLLTRQAMTLGLLPGSADLKQWKALDDQIAALEVTMAARGKSLQGDKAAMKDWIAWADKTSASIDVMAKDIGKASVALEVHKGKTEESAEAQAKAAAAAKAAEAAAKKHAAELKKWAEAAEEVNSAGQSWRATLDTIGGAVVENMRHLIAAGVPLSKLETYYKLTTTQGKAFAAMLAAEKTALKLVDDATKDAATSTRKWLEQTEKATDEYVKAHVKAFLEATAAAEKANDEIALSGVSGKMREIRAIEQKEQAEIDSLSNLRRFYPTIYDELVGIVRQKYELMKTAAVGATQDIIDVAHQLGLKTKDDLAGNLELARNNYEALKNSGVLSLTELRKAWKLLQDAEDAANDSLISKTTQAIGILNSVDRLLSNISHRFAEVGVIAARAASEIAKIAETAHAAGKALSKGDWIAVAVIAATALVSAFGKLFGNNAEKQINKTREGFVQMHGGLAKLNLEATRAGTNLWALLQAKNAKEYQKAIADLDKALSEFKRKSEEAFTSAQGIADKMRGIISISPALQTALEKAFNAKNIDDYQAALLEVGGVLDGEAAKQSRLNELVSKYGLNWTDAGQKFKQATSDNIAKGLIDDFNDLKGVFDNLNPVMEGMKKPLQDFVNDAKKAGVEVPSSMKPVLQTAIDAGVLFDDNGKAITDMKDLGIVFSETMEEKMGDVADAIRDLIAVLLDRLAPALKEVSKPLPNPFGNWTTPDVPGPIPMARGGMGRVTKPTLFLAGESGPEDVAFSGAGKGFGGGGGSGASTVNVTVNAALTTEDVNDVYRLSRTLEKALRQDTNLIRTAFEGIADQRIAAVG